MARIAFITDVHADVHALRDALGQIERLRCERVICCGDVLDYGLFPVETIALLQERGIATVRGNHDRWAIVGGRADEPDAPENDEPRDATAFDLPRSAVRWLASLPTSWRMTIDGVRVVVWHASPGSDMQGIYPDSATADEAEGWLAATQADVLIVGHTHLSFELRTLGGGMIVNPGALLRDSAEARPVGAMVFDPEVGKFVPAAVPVGGTFGLLDVSTRQFTVHRAVDGAGVEIPRKVLGVKDSRVSWDDPTPVRLPRSRR